MDSNNWEENWIEYRKCLKEPDISAFNIDKDSYILDLGCGYGYDLKKFKKLGYDNIVGIDILASLISKCKGQGFNVKIGDMRKIPFEDKTFDCVFAHGIFHHLDNIAEHKQAFEEISRVLKKDGVFCVIEIKNTFLRNIADFITDYFPVTKLLRLRKEVVLKEEKHLVDYWIKNYDSIMSLLREHFHTEVVKEGLFFIYLKCSRIK